MTGVKIGRRPKRCWRCRERLRIGDWIERRPGLVQPWQHKYGCPSRTSRADIVRAARADFEARAKESGT